MLPFLFPSQPFPTNYKEPDQGAALRRGKPRRRAARPVPVPPSQSQDQKAPSLFQSSHEAIHPSIPLPRCHAWYAPCVWVNKPLFLPSWGGDTAKAVNAPCQLAINRCSESMGRSSSTTTTSHRCRLSRRHTRVVNQRPECIPVDVGDLEKGSFYTTA